MYACFGSHDQYMAIYSYIRAIYVNVDAIWHAIQLFRTDVTTVFALDIYGKWKTVA